MKNKTILITGGSGSWGSELISELLREGASRVKVYARSESKLVTIKTRYPDSRVEIILGDIRDRENLLKACAGCDVIFHLAALKHVPICENAPDEAVLTNVIGTQNVIDCAVAQGVEKVIYASTDKAVSPNCAYGSSKLLGEKLIRTASFKNAGSRTKFIVFRSGNLLGSEGSVLPMFARQIAEQKHVILTDKRMNRFFIPVSKAARLLNEAAKRGAGGEIFLPRMPSLWIGDIARYMLAKNGLDETHITVSGSRPGEKFDEVLATPEEKEHLFQVSDDLFVILHQDTHAWIHNEFVTKAEDFPIISKMAVLTYQNTAAFLEHADSQEEKRK